LSRIRIIAVVILIFLSFVGIIADFVNSSNAITISINDSKLLIGILINSVLNEEVRKLGGLDIQISVEINLLYNLINLTPIVIIKKTTVSIFVSWI
jgi:hypothetical protein